MHAGSQLLAANKQSICSSSSRLESFFGTKWRFTANGHATKCPNRTVVFSGGLGCSVESTTASILAKWLQSQRDRPFQQSKYPSLLGNGGRDRQRTNPRANGDDRAGSPF